MTFHFSEDKAVVPSYYGPGSRPFCRYSRPGVDVINYAALRNTVTSLLLLLSSGCTKVFVPDYWDEKPSRPRASADTRWIIIMHQPRLLKRAMMNMTSDGRN